MHAFIICADGNEIGYVQYYNRHYFPPEQNYDISGLPKSCAGLDIYIGEEKYTGKNIGSKALLAFIDQYVFKEFDSVFVDPDSKNIQAIRAYEKAGFVTHRPLSKDDGKIMFLIKRCQTN
jgi:aminoglycoside 6'-N-acetyltransferase